MILYAKKIYNNLKLMVSRKNSSNQNIDLNESKDMTIVTTDLESKFKRAVNDVYFITNNNAMANRY
jgi:hypothetical protein